MREVGALRSPPYYWDIGFIINMPCDFLPRIGATRFELAASWTQTRRSTKLNYTPVILSRHPRIRTQTNEVGARCATVTPDAYIKNAGARPPAAGLSALELRPI